jgi:hypothetical protein
MGVAFYISVRTSAELKLAWADECPRIRKAHTRASELVAFGQFTPYIPSSELIFCWDNFSREQENDDIPIHILKKPLTKRDSRGSILSPTVHKSISRGKGIIRFIRDFQ